MRSKKVNIYLNPENPPHKAVLDYLAGSNLSATDAIAAAVMAYQQGKKSEDALIEAVKQTIKDCLTGQALPSAPSPDASQLVACDENEEAVADFLSFFKK